MSDPSLVDVIFSYLQCLASMNKEGALPSHAPLPVGSASHAASTLQSHSLSSVTTFDFRKPELGSYSVGRKRQKPKLTPLLLQHLVPVLFPYIWTKDGHKLGFALLYACT